MQVRFITQGDDDDMYKLLTIIDVSSYEEIMRLLMYMKEEDIPIEINTNDIADTGGEEYSITDVRFIVPTLGGEIGEYISVYVE